MQNKIKINLKFKDYEFRRVTRMGETSVIYTKKEWVGKTVLIIPVPITVTDRWIERQQDFDERINDTIYDVTIESDTIIKKVIGVSSNVGRGYVPKELLGLDCLVIEAPFLNNF